MKIRQKTQDLKLSLRLRIHILHHYYFTREPNAKL